jgi:hypothetical protein
MGIVRGKGWTEGMGAIGFIGARCLRDKLLQEEDQILSGSGLSGLFRMKTDQGRRIVSWVR